MVVEQDRWIRMLPSPHAEVARVGGKAAGLSRLMDAGLPVPPAFAVTTSAFAEATRGVHADVEQVLAAIDPDDASAVATASAAARRLVREATANHPVLARVADAYEALGGGVAVRSSGVDEDGAQSSHAGEHDTYLWVRGADAVVARVQDCWASLYTERAVAYRRRLGLPARGLGVVVQRMVDARASGVLMTLDPQNGDRSLLAVESVWGLGEALVSGSVTPDRYLVSKVTGEVVRRDVARKVRHLTICPVDGTTSRPVPDELVHVPSLEPHELAALHAQAERLEAVAHGPADVEFAIDDRLWFLQVRPETYWANRPRRRPAARGSALQAILATLGPARKAQ